MRFSCHWNARMFFSELSRRKNNLMGPPTSVGQVAQLPHAPGKPPNRPASLEKPTRPGWRRILMHGGILSPPSDSYDLVRVRGVGSKLVRRLSSVQGSVGRE